MRTAALALLVAACGGGQRTVVDEEAIAASRPVAHDVIAQHGDVETIRFAEWHIDLEVPAKTRSEYSSSITTKSVLVRGEVIASDSEILVSTPGWSPRVVLSRSGGAPSMADRIAELEREAEGVQLETSREEPGGYVIVYSLPGTPDRERYIRRVLSIGDDVIECWGHQDSPMDVEKVCGSMRASSPSR
jgi:hypothetical protein